MVLQKLAPYLLALDLISFLDAKSILIQECRGGLFRELYGGFF